MRTRSLWSGVWNCLFFFNCFYSSFWRRKWQPTPVFLPGESQGWGSLVGCRLWGCKESDTTKQQTQDKHVDPSPGHRGTYNMSCSAFLHRQHPQGEVLNSSPARSGQTASVRDAPINSASSGGLTGLPSHSKGFLNSKFILPEKRKESDINCKLNQVSLDLNIKNEG